MLVDIRPEPSEVERAAITVALEYLLTDHGGSRVAAGWWQAGLSESLENEDGPSS